MNYFIDFEATQFSNRIISVGVVGEDGRQFYSLINPNRQITKFITDLTGITQADVDAAPSADEVFSDLYDFCKEDDTLPVFYCYGDGDVVFANDTFHKMISSFKAGAMLGYIRTGLIDFSPIVKAHFGLSNNIKLAKVADYYRGEELVQNHNALDDALLLKYVYEQIQEHENEFDAFPEYRIQKAAKEIVKKEKSKIIGYRVFRLGKSGGVAETYESLSDAIMWIYNNKVQENQKNTVNLGNIGNKIKAAGNSGKLYYKIRWVVSPITEVK